MASVVFGRGPYRRHPRAQERIDLLLEPDGGWKARGLFAQKRRDARGVFASDTIVRLNGKCKAQPEGRVFVRTINTGVVWQVTKTRQRCEQLRGRTLE